MTVNLKKAKRKNNNTKKGDHLSMLSLFYGLISDLSTE